LSQQFARTGLELLLGLTCKWATESGLGLLQALERVSSGPARVLAGSLGPTQTGCGQLAVGALADVCIFDPQASWTVTAEGLRSQGKHTPFAFEHGGVLMPGRVQASLVAGTVAYEAGA
jgi:dihydroorotase